MPPYSRPLIASLCLYFACLQAKATDHPDWTTPLPPFQIADNLYYVGSRDLAAYLITTPAGNILINANLASSPPLIRASVEKLGFSWKETRILLNGQAHFDHMGGAAEVLRETPASDMVMDGDADAVPDSKNQDETADVVDAVADAVPDSKDQDETVDEVGAVASARSAASGAMPDDSKNQDETADKISDDDTATPTLHVEDGGDIDRDWVEVEVEVEVERVDTK